MKMLNKIQSVFLAILILLVWAGPDLSLGHAGNHPQRIILNLTETPYNSCAVTWRTSKLSEEPMGEIIPAADLLDTSKTPETCTAKSSVLITGNQTSVYHYSVVFKGLKPGTLYACRVGSEHSWSPWSQFRTAVNRPESFSFVYFGDIQKGLFSMCPQVFQAAFQKDPDAAFWLFIGDMVNNGEDDREWGDFFSALGWMSRTVPQVLTAGNHEYPDPRITPPEQHRITPFWRPQFTLPENGPQGLGETAYCFEYQGAFFVVLNGNEKIEEQAAWMASCLSKNQLPWVIAAVHQPAYSISKHRDTKDYQKIFVPVFDRFSVDLVLQGHDHGYARTAPLKHHKPVGDDEPGTIYLISNSGAKFYSVSSRYDHLMEKTMSRNIWFHTIQINRNTLSFKAYNVAKEMVDSFVIQKHMKSIKK
ncbi:MAG: metallophosphoesterase family protein [Thermodesulfobacteriota bacterium]|nr:metallophosphoesterase family protein [Thermodesulfobacteriota bacterium]